MLGLSPVVGAEDAGGNGQLLWLVLVPCTAVAFAVNTRLVYFEGCGRMAQVAHLRAMQAIGGVGFFFLLLWMGAGLWSALAQPCVQTLTGSIWLRKAGKSQGELRELPAGFWRAMVWPMQWRIALSWAAGYVATSIFVPATFAHHGAVEAGRLGLSQAIFRRGRSFGAGVARVPEYAVLYSF